MTQLTDDQGRALTALARASIAAELGKPSEWPPHDPDFDRVGGSFVTLTLNGALRGCIGTLQPYRTIREDVEQNALAAAFSDPRFPALTGDELDRVLIEVSLLSKPVPIEFDGTEASAVRALRPGVDGVVLKAGHHRATYLPQVWEQLPEPDDFLRSLKRKARLDQHFWSPDVQLSRYEVTSWVER